jgi:hypothetical protein
VAEPVAGVAGRDPAEPKDHCSANWPASELEVRVVDSVRVVLASMGLASGGTEVCEGARSPLPFAQYRSSRPLARQAGRVT